jgi:hypothetical protein
LITNLGALGWRGLLDSIPLGLSVVATTTLLLIAAQLLEWRSGGSSPVVERVVRRAAIVDLTLLVFLVIVRFVVIS